MSLIRDALERAREEAERQRRGAAPPERSRSYRRPTAGPGSGRWVVLATGAALGALLAGGGIYLAARARAGQGPVASVPVVASAPEATSPPAERGEELQAPLEAAPPELVIAPEASPETRAETPPPASAVVAAAVATTPDPAPTPPPSAPGTPEPPNPPAVTPAPRPDPPPPRATAPAPTPEAVGAATTPGGATLDLGGIAYSETGPVALVNGKPLAPGEGLVSSAGEAYLVESIERDRVTLVSAGTRLVIRLR